MSDLALLRYTIRDLLAARKVVAATFLIVLPAAIAVLWRVLSPGRHLDPDIAYNTLSAGLVFGFTLVILAVIFGTGVITADIEQKTVVYLLTHAVPRWRILAIKFVAAFCAITLNVWLSSLLLAIAIYGPSHFTHSALGRDLEILPVGSMVYGALFVLAAAALNRPLIYGLLYAFGWESWVPSLPGDFGRLSIMAYLRILAPHPQPESDTVDLSSLISSLNPSTISHRLAWEVILIVIVVCLVGAVLIFSHKEYVARDDAV